MKRAAVFGMLTVAGIVHAGPANAHHSFAMFDMDKTVAITGTVKELQWTNPHSWIQIDAPSNGQSTEWSIEAPGTSMLMKVGWRKASLNPGDKAEIIVHPLRTGQPGGALVSAKVNGNPIGRPIGSVP